jgi:hypothetical protein
VCLSHFLGTYTPRPLFGSGVSDDFFTGCSCFSSRFRCSPFIYEGFKLVVSGYNMVVQLRERELCNIHDTWVLADRVNTCDNYSTACPLASVFVRTA